MRLSILMKIVPPGIVGLCLVAAASLQAADPAIADLVRTAKSGEESARIKAIDQIAAQGEKAAEAVTPLTQLLSHGSAGVRAHSAHALGSIGAASKPAAEALTNLVKDNDESVRRQAVKALIAIRPGPEIVIPLFVKLMEDSDSGVRIRILHAVSEAGPAAVPGLIKALDNEKAAYWACLVLREMGAGGKDAVPALAAKLKDQDPEIRREAALTLGAMQEAAAAAVPQLAAAVSDEHTQVAATFALGQIGRIPAEAESKIKANAAGENKFLSTVSYWALSRVHPEDKELRRKATERLVERLMDKDAYVRVAAARALAALQPAPEISIPIIEKALQTADETTAHHAMDALASLGAPAVPRLLDVLKHKKLRAQVAYTLGEIGPAAAPATDALAKLVGDADSRVATEAALALAKIGPDAKAAVPALTAALQQKDCPNAHAIVYALGKIGRGAASAEPALLTSMQSSDRGLALLSAWALTQIRPPTPELVAKAVPVLVAGLLDPLPESRHSAIEALGSLGPVASAAIPALTKAASDPDKSVRDAAAEALRSIRALGPPGPKPPGPKLP